MKVLLLIFKLHHCSNEGHPVNSLDFVLVLCNVPNNFYTPLSWSLLIPGSFYTFLTKYCSSIQSLFIKDHTIRTLNINLLQIPTLKHSSVEVFISVFQTNILSLYCCFVSCAGWSSFRVTILVFLFLIEAHFQFIRNKFTTSH